MLHFNKFLLKTLTFKCSEVCLAPLSTTVNERETKLFGEWSEDWWDVNGPAKGLHNFNVLRVSFIRDELLKKTIPVNRLDNIIRRGDSNLLLKGFSIADVGCGAGILTESLAKRGADVTGIDASAVLIKVAREHAALEPELSASDKLKYENVMIEDYSGSYARRYDAVVCSEVIEHVDHKELFVEHCVKLVKSGGSLIFTTVNRTPIAWASVIFWTENIVRAIPKGTHHYNMFITPKELETILIKNGCFMRTLQGTSATPTLNKFYNVNHLQFCYSMHAIKH